MHVQCFIILLNPVVIMCSTRFSIKKFSVTPLHFVFCMSLRTNSNYFCIQC